MLIKIENKIKKKDRKDFLRIFFKYYFIVTSLILILLLFLVSQTGYWGNYKATFLDRFYKSSYNNYLKLPIILPQALNGFFVNLPVININISLEKQLILEKDRKKALKNKDAFLFEFKKVPASINFNNSEFKIDLRLKGDRDIHYKEKDKSSYKIELRNDEKIFGINKFSLMKPRARNYIHEWIYHQLMEDNGLINLKYEFVNLKLNGESQGLYILEEGFDKILIERNKRRNGPIYSIKEEWTSVLNNSENKEPLFQVYNKKNWLNDDNLQIALYGNKLLKNFFKNKIELDEIFDEDKWAMFMAISDLNYYEHGNQIKSVKFYFNTISKKFEPVPFDGHRIVVDLNENIKGWQNFRNIKPSFQLAVSCIENYKTCHNPFPSYFFFNTDGSLNKNFFEKYRKSIKKITSNAYLDKFFSDRKKEIFKFNSKIYSDYFYADNTQYYGPGLYYFNQSEIYKRAKRLKSKISTIPTNILISQQNDMVNVKNWNISKSTIFNNRNLFIKDINCINRQTGEKFNLKINKNLENFENFFVLNIKNLTCNSLNIYDQILGDNFNLNIDHLDKNYKSNKKFFVADYLDYFKIQNDNLILKENKILITENLFIPKGFKVLLKANQKIILMNNSFLISDSAFEANGGSEKNGGSIEIGGLEQNNGGGIFIKNTSDLNFFNNVIFKNLNGNSKFIPEGYVTYGAINFFNSKVHFNNFSIENISSEDAINFVNSEVSLVNGKFKNIKSDAIDIDHGSGKIEKLNIINVSNDGLDFSESKVKVSEIYFENIGDKSISAGENSSIIIDNINISNSYLGIASKDGSSVTVNNIKNLNVTIPYASYVKKKEYSKPILSIFNSNEKNYHKLYLKDNLANITINNEKKTEVTKEILELIYDPKQKIQ